MVSPVQGLTLTRTHAAGAFAAYTATERAQPIVFRARGVTIPSVDTSYLLLEMGATGSGMGVWYQTGLIRVRSGVGGGSTPNTDHVYGDATVTKGSTIDITVEFDPPSRTLRMWFGEALVASATASQAMTEWAGGDNAGYGSTASSTALNVPTTAWPTPLPNPLEAYVNQKSTWTVGGTAESSGTGGGSFTTGGTGAGSADASGQGTGSFTTGGTGSGASEASGTGSGGFDAGGTGAGSSEASGQGSGGFDTTGTGSGSGEVSTGGTGSGSFDTSGQGSGASEAAGQGSGSFDTGGSGTGEAEPPPGGATGSGSFDTGATGEGTVQSSGTGSGGLDTGGTGTGGVEASGQGSGGLTTGASGSGTVEAGAPPVEVIPDITIRAGRTGIFVFNSPPTPGEVGPASVDIDTKHKDEEVIIDLFLLKPDGTAESDPASKVVSIVFSSSAGGKAINATKFDFTLLDAPTAHYRRVLSPADLLSLEEDKPYNYNLWSKHLNQVPVFRGSGTFKLLFSISLPEYETL